MHWLAVKRVNFTSHGAAVKTAWLFSLRFWFVPTVMEPPFLCIPASHLLMDSSHFPQCAVQWWWYDVCIYISRLCYAICQFVIYKCFQIGIQCVPFIFVAIACRFITFLSQLSTEWMMLERGSLKKEWLRYAFPTLRSEWQMSELLFLLSFYGFHALKLVQNAKRILLVSGYRSSTYIIARMILRICNGRTHFRSRKVRHKFRMVFFCRNGR